MVNTDRLFLLTDALDITVEYRELSKINPQLEGVADANKRTITLDTLLKNHPREEKCVFAEEIGHILYPPRPGHILYHRSDFWYYDNNKRSNIKITVAQDERKALDWATRVLVPDVEFNRILESGNFTIGEIAEYFEVEPWFTRLKIAYYRRKEREAGRSIKWRDLIRRV